VQIFHCSAAEGQRFQTEAIRISEEIANLGGNPLREAIKSNQKKSSDDEKKN